MSLRVCRMQTSAAIIELALSVLMEPRQFRLTLLQTIKSLICSFRMLQLN